MTFILPSDQVFPLEQIRPHVKVKCALCWFEHGIEHMSKTPAAAKRHLRSKHRWWADRREGLLR